MLVESYRLWSMPWLVRVLSSSGLRLSDNVLSLSKKSMSVRLILALPAVRRWLEF